MEAGKDALKRARPVVRPGRVEIESMVLAESVVGRRVDEESREAAWRCDEVSGMNE